MKLSPLLFAGLLLIASVASAALKTGNAAPDFTLPDTKGVMHKLSDLKGKYVVLEWTNHQCPFVKKHYKSGNMQATQKELTDDGVVWLQIVSSAEGKQGHVTAEQGEAMRKKQGHHSTAMLFDPSGRIGRRYSARTTPQMFVINPEGVVIYQGAIDSIPSARSSDINAATNYVKMAYRNAKAGKSIEPAATTPYGCGVKY